MGVKKPELAELLSRQLSTDDRMHFNYHKLFLNGVNINNTSEVTAFIQNEYMNGQSLEEFALQILAERIQTDVQKFSAKNPIKTGKIERAGGQKKNSESES